MGYTSVQLKCDEDTAETISVLLQELNYTGTAYEDGVLTAYCLEQQFDQTELEQTLAGFSGVQIVLGYEADQNWNELWEKNFHDTVVEDIQIRAPFHPSKGLNHEIIIHPKMAFGTGHHPTTKLMLQALNQLDLNAKQVLDMGCGSGILAIFASQKGARQVLAIDYDSNSVENSTENVQLNGLKNVRVSEASNLDQVLESFDVILSNIIRSVNLELLPAYVERCEPGGLILLSGLLLEDRSTVLQAAEVLKLQYQGELIDENWIQLSFKRP